MNNFFLDFLLYLGNLLILTLGVFVICGFAVRFCSRAFSMLLGGGSATVFDVTSVIGTPIHEIGHAVMCPLFGHKITAIKLWAPRAENGVYGYVEHAYNRKNPWAMLGNLFIGLGPLFSGLGIVVLMLLLCFPAQWSNYLETSKAVVSADGIAASGLFKAIFSLFLSMFDAFRANWLRSLVGLIVILAVCLHISLSLADIKGSLSALPIYLAMLALFALATQIAGLSAPILAELRLLNLRVLSIFCIVIAFAAVWVLIALIVRLIRKIIHAF